MKKIITLFVVMIGVGSMLHAQTKTKSELKGDSFYFIYDFGKAISAYETTVLTEEGIRKYAISLKKTGQYEKAETEYATLVNLTNSKAIDDYFEYANLLKINGKYDAYFTWMDNFVRLNPTDLRALSYQNNKAKFNALRQNNATQEVISMDINTAAQDFGTVFYNGNIVFASSRSTGRMIQRTDNWTGQSYLTVFESKVDGDQLKKPRRFNRKLSSSQNDGPVSFAKKGTFMAFTQNNLKDKRSDKIVELQLHFSSLDGKKWSKPTPFAYNNPAYSVGQPCLSEDGKTLYFTSDMPGGVGGTDLYMCFQQTDGSWSKPENLGKEVNTESDEMFPYFVEQTGILYFASDGHMGIGGFDIFSFGANGVENVGAPINSNQDDFAFILNPTTRKGYFSSNRTTGKGLDDVYGFQFKNEVKQEFRIEGVAKSTDNLILDDVVITLMDEEGSILQKTTTRSNQKYSFKVPMDQKFTLIGNKQDYKEGKSTTQTFGQDSVVICDLVLTQETKKDVAGEVIDVEVIDVKADLAKVIAMKPIYFDFDLYAISAAAAIELDKIVAILNKYPTMEIELKSYTDCRGSELYNQYLSEQRASETVGYIRSRITNPNRITGKGFGETNSLNDCVCVDNVLSDCPKSEHQQNRRTEFIVVKK